MRLVLDTNVVVSAVLGSGAPARLIELATEAEIELAASSDLLAELADVLAREPIARRLALAETSLAELSALYESLVDLVEPASIARTAPDPDDDRVLACALAAGADLIVSGDKRFRNLKSWQRIPIVSPTEALEMIARKPAGA
ncbi:MAG: putative toxin-antitoxin system toxin component, PIN family [Betaproteobacteria bacterium]|nr:putative toxin-antitoxin system toxin component, PIN family [Betaproteobacteria bacterium]